MSMIEWVNENMRLVKKACKDVGNDLKDYRIAISFPLEYKTAVLIRELSQYCEVLVTPFSPATTKDEAVAWLEEKGIKVLEVSDVVEADYYLDCVAKIVREAHKMNRLNEVGGVIELTRSGLDYLEKIRVKKAIIIDSSFIKGVGENIYGTGLGLIDGLLRLNLNLIGKTAVVVGYGKVGKGCAMILKKFCRVIIVEIDPIRALEAACEGYEVKDLPEALGEADIIVTCAGRERVIADFDYVKNGCIICNMSAYPNEIDTSSLDKWTVKDFGFLKKYSKDDRYFYVVADREAVNLALGNGTPIEIMDRTFATVVYALRYLIREDFSGLIPLPREIDVMMCEIALRSTQFST